jgi:hypothetical protein
LSGRFLFVVEAAPGASLRPPSVAGTRRGEFIEPLGSFDRPGLQVRFGQPLGDGSAFVECGTDEVGGVPAAVGLSDAQLTAAMIDAACRFEWLPDSQPCTRGRFGDFSTLSDDTVTQYCFQVPTAAEFADGDTVAYIQVRDTQGNLGPAEEIVIRVGTAAPTPTPTPTLAGQFAISGVVAHYQTGAPVGGAVVDESASGRSTTTAANGVFALSNLPPALVELVPRKDGGLGNAISPLDATYVLQATANLRSLGILQRIACDVSGDGTISNLDATRILQWTVRSIDRLPVTGPELCGSDWAFFPFPAAAPQQTTVTPSLAGAVCRHGAIRYDPLSANAAGQSFFGIPFGDCTGNWQTAGAALSAPAASAGVARLGSARRSRAGRIEVPLYVDGTESFGAALVEIAYDAEMLIAGRTRRGGGAGDAVLVENRATPGRLRLALAAKRPAAIAGEPLVVLRFRARPSARRADPSLRVVNALIESAPPQ